jgi:transposase
MYNNSVSIPDIVVKEGVTKHAIFGIVRRYRHEESAKENSRSGRPSIITDRDKNHTLRIIDSDSFISCREIIGRFGLCCHKSTLTRWLKKQGVQHYLSLPRPFLGPTAV